MNESCFKSPEDKKAYVSEVGQILVKDYGKKKYYSPKEVRSASAKSSYNFDFHCWAMCVFCSFDDFGSYHDSIGEVCDYTSMKSEMASALTDSTSSSWFDVDLSWLEWPDFELPSMFDLLD